MPLNQPYQFSKEFEIMSFQVDPKGKLRWASLGDLLQEVAWKHADSRMFGQVLFDKGLAWVLSRFHIQVNQMPRWGEKILVETAGRGQSKLFALREFRVTDGEGKQLAWAMSAWLLLDTKSKRPQSPASVLPPELFDSISDGNLLPPKVDVVFSEESQKVIEVVPSDLDMNDHVNNVSYLRWIENMAKSRGLAIETLKINYLSEALCGQEISISTDEVHGQNLISGVHGGKPIFAAALSIAEK